MFRKHSKVLIIDGKKVPIDPDFRIMCEYSAAVSKGDRKMLENIASRFFFAELPEGVSGRSAAKAMEDLYRNRERQQNAVSEVKTELHEIRAEIAESREKVRGKLDELTQRIDRFL